MSVPLHRGALVSSAPRSLKSQRAAASRLELLAVLGGVCAQCSSVVALEFDCKQPQGPEHHLMAWPERIRFYWKQHGQGNLQLLCPSCHLKKTQRDNSKVRLSPWIGHKIWPSSVPWSDWMI